MAAQIYILFACDQWKSAESMRLVCATTDEERLAEVILSEIEAGDMSFFWGNSEEDQGASAFGRFCSEDPGWRFVNGPLEFGHLEIVDDGEVL